MGNDQAVAGETGLGQSPASSKARPGRYRPARHSVGRDGQDELQLPPALVASAVSSIDVVEAQQAAIGHQDDTLDREALQNGRQHGLQRLGLGDIAGVDGVHERQAIRRLHHAETN
jgi:hypothetical protein